MTYLPQRRLRRKPENPYLRPHIAAMVAWAVVAAGGTVRTWAFDWPAPRTRQPQFEAVGQVRR